MKYFFVILIVVMSSVSGMTRNRTWEQEKLIYKVEYLKLPAGILKFEMQGITNIDSQLCYHLQVEAHTNRMFTPLFGVKNQYESYFDEKTLLPRMTRKNVQQRNIMQKMTIIFDQTNNCATIGDSLTWALPDSCFGFFSMLYLIRSKLGTSMDRTVFHLDSEHLPSIGRAFVQDTTDISVPVGTYRTLKVKLMFTPLTKQQRPWKTDLLTNRLADPYAEITIWFSADERRLPVMFEFSQKSSAVKLLLTSYSGEK